MNIPKIYADFNNADRQGRLRLTTRGSEEDIKIQNLKLFNGMEVIVHDADELSTNAKVIFSEEEKIWVAQIDWSKIK